MILNLYSGQKVFEQSITFSTTAVFSARSGGGGGGRGGTPIYGLYRYVPRNRVWFLRFSVLKLGIFFDPFVAVFSVWSFDRVAKLYYLILE